MEDSGKHLSQSPADLGLIFKSLSCTASILSAKLFLNNHFGAYGLAGAAGAATTAEYA